MLLNDFRNYCNADNIILMIVGVCIGVTITLLATFALHELYANVTIGNTTYEVVVNNFLGYEELMIVRRVSE